MSLELAASAKTSEAMLCALAAAIPEWLQLVQVFTGGGGGVYTVIFILDSTVLTRTVLGQ